MPRFVQLRRGDPAPWFTQRSAANPRYTFDTAAGRYLVLCFFGSAQSEFGRQRLQTVFARPDLFDDSFASFFGISADPADETGGAVREHYPGYRFFWDFDARVARLYGAAPGDVEDAAALQFYRPQWVIIDPMLRIADIVPADPDGGDCAALIAALERLPPVDAFAAETIPPPVLVLPNVFDPALCQQLIDIYEAEGGEVSGFMRDIDNKTVGIHDSAHKVRRDCHITKQPLVGEIQHLIHRRVKPEVQKAFQFDATRMERYIVACYAAEEGGHFRAHRDNTSKGTAHRRFAITINLNDDFDGGLLSFPEFRSKGFKPGVGTALVFSCSLLHSVAPVTRGKRYAFLPFLYDEAAAQLREQNAAYTTGELANYKSGTSKQGGE